jgi:hypothetical protein
MLFKEGKMAICHKGITDEKAYYKMLIGQYRLVDETRKGKTPTAAAVIEEVIRMAEQTGAICWEDLYTIDKALLQFLTREEMECRLLFLADMYREIAGDQNFASRIKIKIAELKGVSDETLRGELSELVDDMYRHLALYTACRKSRRKIMRSLVIFLLILLLCPVVLIFKYDGNMPPILYITIAGMIGGMVSAIRRLQEAASTDTNTLTYIDLKYGWLNILLAPIYGATFSLVLLLFFTAGFLKGELFPVMITMTEEIADKAGTVSDVMQYFFVNTYPEAGADCAKLIVWSFIAGFAEQFVPDTLDRLIARSQKTENKN